MSLQRNRARTQSWGWTIDSPDIAHVSSLLVRAGYFSVFVTVLGLLACSEVSHHSLDDWMKLTDGAGRLEKALRNPGLAVELRAHAAVNLTRPEVAEQARVWRYLGSISPEPRAKLVDALIPQLWELARIEEADKVFKLDLAARDALFELRLLATPEQLRKLDTHLLDWLTGDYYVRRGRLSSRYSGATVVSAIGSAAGSRLLASMDEFLAGATRGQRRIEDVMLLGLASTGDPVALGRLVELAGDTRQLDGTLRSRITTALLRAYQEPEQGGRRPSSTALAGYSTQLIALARRSSPVVAARIVELLTTLAPPWCTQAAVRVMRSHDIDAVLKRRTLEGSVVCSGAAGITAALEALPSPKSLNFDDWDWLWAILAKLPDHRAVVEAAHTLLQSKNPLSRTTGVEVLDRIRQQIAALPGPVQTRCARALAGLKGDKTRLRGWPRGSRARASLGSRAIAVSQRLQELAKPPQNQR